MLDRPGPVRPGEGLDLDKLEAFLRARLPGFAGPLEVAQFPSGYSNLTYCLNSPGGQFVLRRPPFGAERIRGGHDMRREFSVLSALHPHSPRAPEPLLFCEDPAVIGAPFYLMERVEGVILRREPPPGLALDEGTMARLSRAFVDNLVELHALAPESLGLQDFGKPQGYCRRQVEGWTRRYLAAKTDEHPELERAARWLGERVPAESGAALIHNDYKYDNLVLDPQDVSEIRAVLDWEMATVGDPLMDLGTTLAYWVQADDPPELQGLRFCLTHLPGNLTRAQLVERYARRSGRRIDDARFYYAYGLFKLAVIVQQLHYRYRKGLTQDARFAELGRAAGALARLALRAVERGL